MPHESRRSRWVIEPYIGYGTPAKLLVPGRVLKDRGVIRSADLDSKWRNLRNAFRRFHTGEVGGALVRARYAGAEASAVTDSEGYFTIEVEPRSSDVTTPWLEVPLELDRPRAEGQTVATATAAALVPPPSARFGVISDIDDTVVATNVTSTWKMLATVLLSNPHVRTPFEGIAAFYRALHAGQSGDEGNPIFYVSNGPSNFFGLLLELFKLNGIPLGPIFLRDFGPRLLFSRGSSHGRHKLLHVQRLLETYASLPFILIGDSGERDPEIYAEAVRRYAGRIRAIYIRSIDRRPERLAAMAALAEEVKKTTTQFVVAPDSAFAAAHAAAEGLIASSALAMVVQHAKL